MGSKPSDAFIKFVRTPHLFSTGATLPREDKLLAPDEAAALLRMPAAIEEKVDGACIGFSVASDGQVRVQSRGRYLTRGEQGQFRPLWSWLVGMEEALRRALGTRLILFGEWCYARHTVRYDTLPDWFLAFDVYARDAGRFWSRELRNDLVERVGLVTVPQLATGTCDRHRLDGLLGQSRFGPEFMEGLYLRWDEGSWLVARAKLLRPGWVQADDKHWSRRPLETNRLAGAEPRTISARA